MYHCGFICKGDIDMESNVVKFGNPLIYITKNNEELVFSDTLVSEISLSELLNRPPSLHHWSHEFTGSDTINLDRLPIGTTDFYLSQSGSDLLLTDLSVGTVSLSELLNIPPHASSHELGGDDQINLAGLPFNFSSSYITGDASNLIFFDVAAGPKSLSELVYHHSNHEKGGIDEIDLKDLPIGGSDAYLSRSGNDLTFTDPNAGTYTLTQLAEFLGPHAASHESGGSDEIDIENLGVGGTDAYFSRIGSELAFTDPVTGTKTLAELASGVPSKHASTHEAGGSDEIDIKGLRIGDSNAFLSRNPSSDLTFTDPNTGTKTLAELSAGGGVSDVIVDSDGSGDFVDIQSAVDALASSGGRIGIRSGSYVQTNSLALNSSNISLIGGNRDVTLISGSLSGNLMDVIGQRIQIRDLSLVLGAGLSALESQEISDLSLENVVLRNLIEQPYPLAFFSGSGRSFTINNCEFDGAGIRCINLNQVRISNSVLSVRRTDKAAALIHLQQVSGAVIDSNHLKGIQCGLYPEDSLYPDNALYPEDCLLYPSTSLYPSTQIYPRGEKINLIGIWIDSSSSNIIISQNIIEPSLEGYSIRVDGDQNIIKDNFISGDLLLSGSNNLVINNIIAGEILDFGTQNTIAFNLEV